MHSVRTLILHIFALFFFFNAHLCGPVSTFVQTLPIIYNVITLPEFAKKSEYSFECVAADITNSIFSSITKSEASLFECDQFINEMWRDSTLTLFQVQISFAVFPDSKVDSGKKKVFHTLTVVMSPREKYVLLWEFIEVISR